MKNWLTITQTERRITDIASVGPWYLFLYVQYNMRVNEWKTNTDSYVLYLSVHYSAWSVEQHEVKPSGHSIGPYI